VKKIQALALKAFRGAELSGMARVIFRGEKVKDFPKRVNTFRIHFDQHVPQEWEASGIPFRS